MIHIVIIIRVKFEMLSEMFDWEDVKAYICETATFTWEVIGYIHQYIDETEFIF